MLLHYLSQANQNSIDVFQHLIVPEANNTIAGFLQSAGALRVDQFLMLAAVHFDDQPCLPTKKVRDEGSDRGLSSELEAAQLTRPELLPKQPLGVSLVPPQLSCAGIRSATYESHE